MAAQPAGQVKDSEGVAYLLAEAWDRSADSTIPLRWEPPVLHFSLNGEAWKVDLDDGMIGPTDSDVWQLRRLELDKTRDIPGPGNLLQFRHVANSSSQATVKDNSLAEPQDAPHCPPHHWLIETQYMPDGSVESWRCLNCQETKTITRTKHPDKSTWALRTTFKPETVPGGRTSVPEVDTPGG
jgi:hypothetical protein